jgi:hypothetical protein
VLIFKSFNEKDAGIYTCVGIKKTELGLKETSVSLKFQEKGKNVFEGIIIPLNMTNKLNSFLREKIDEPGNEFIEMLPIALVKIKAEFPIKYGSDVFFECYNMFQFGKKSF